MLGKARQIQSVFNRALNILGHDSRMLCIHGPRPLTTTFAAAMP